MGRPPAFDRKQAIDTVMQNIWRRGYEASSVKAISEKLGITRSSFYNSFGSREALFREVLEAYAAHSPDRALDDIDENTAVPEALHSMFREVCRVRANDPESRGCLAVNSVAELVGNHGELGPCLEEAIAVNTRRFARVVELGIRRGEIAEQDIATLALTLQNLLVGLNVMAKVVRDEALLWAIAETTLVGLGVVAHQ